MKIKDLKFVTPGYQIININETDEDGNLFGFLFQGTVEDIDEKWDEFYIIKMHSHFNDICSWLEVYV